MTLDASNFSQPTPDAQALPANPDLANATPGNGQPPDASNVNPAPPQVSYEEYKALEQQLEATRAAQSEDAQLIERFRQLAEQSEADAQRAQFMEQIKADARDAIQRAGDDDEAINQIVGLMERRIGEVEANYQQKFTGYQQQVQTWATGFEWGLTREQTADKLIKDNGLSPALKPELLKAQTREQMELSATTAKSLQDLYTQQIHSQTVQGQENARRASGADAMGSVNPGPITGDIKPGRNLDMLGAIFNHK